jgi:hypothetical protein
LGRALRASAAAALPARLRTLSPASRVSRVRAFATQTAAACVLALALAALACAALAVRPGAANAQTVTIDLTSPLIQTPTVSAPLIQTPTVSAPQVQSSTVSASQVQVLTVSASQAQSSAAGFTQTQFPFASFFPVQPGALATSNGASPSSQAASLTVDQTAVIDGSTYRAVNGVTYAKTASGLLVVLSPAQLTGSGPLARRTEGLSLEIPDTLIRDLFF